MASMALWVASLSTKTCARVRWERQSLPQEHLKHKVRAIDSSVKMSLLSPPRFRFTLPWEGADVERTQAADGGVLCRRTRGRRTSNSPSDSDDDCVSLSEEHFGEDASTIRSSRPACGLAGGRLSGSGTCLSLEALYWRMSADARARGATELSPSGSSINSRRSSSSSLESSTPTGKDDARLFAHASAGPWGPALLPARGARRSGTAQTSLPRRRRQIGLAAEPPGRDANPAPPPPSRPSRGVDAG